MTDLDDLRRRAAQQSQVGNYWAGKCLGLIDMVREAERGADVVDLTTRLPAPRRVVFEVTWEPWPDRGPERVDPMLRARVARNLDRLADELRHVAADIHVATADDPSGLPAARRAVGPTYAEQCERDAAESAGAWGDLPAAPFPHPTPSTGEQT